MCTLREYDSIFLILDSVNLAWINSAVNYLNYLSSKFSFNTLVPICFFTEQREDLFTRGAVSPNFLEQKKA